MRHDYGCDNCGETIEVVCSIAEKPPESVPCKECDGFMEKVYGVVNFITRSDPDDIPPEFQSVDVGGGIGANGLPRRVTPGQVMGPSKISATRKERAYQRHIEARRRQFAEHGQKGGRFTHEVPIEIYFGRIRQTGDEHYWEDEENVKRHKSCKVD